jgi:hypothetical protein
MAGDALTKGRVFPGQMLDNIMQILGQQELFFLHLSVLVVYCMYESSKLMWRCGMSVVYLLLLFLIHTTNIRSQMFDE